MAHVSAEPSDSSEPSDHVLAINSPTAQETTCGLILIHGWAFVKEARVPEGMVEVWIDGYDRVVAHDRFPVDGVDPSNAWAARGGFRVTVNSFFLPNGIHNLYVQLSDQGQELR